MKILIDTEEKIIQIITKESHNDIIKLGDIIEDALFNYPVLASEVTDIPEEILEEYVREGSPVEINNPSGQESVDCDVVPKSNSYDNKN